MRKSQVIAEWRAEGKAEGMAEARIESRRASLLRIFQVRFPSPIPRDLTKAIETMTDFDKLTHWFDSALTTTSWKEFRAAVRRR